MKLHFPNPSCSYDQSHNRVLFWGYDNTLEVSFFLDTTALKKLDPEVADVEEAYLKAFASARDKIYEVADKVYSRGGGDQGTYAYVLAAEDF